MACVTGTVCVDGQCAAEPENRTVVEVPASAGWIDSGIDLATGQTLGIRVNGVAFVSASDGGRPPVGTRGCLASPSALAPDLACHALVGSIGGEAPFEIGYGIGFVVPQIGRLLLGVNDDSLDDNAGGFSVFVSVVDASSVEQGTPTPVPTALSKGDKPTKDTQPAASTSCAGTGATCATNSACCSGVCVNNLCKASRVAMGGTCDETADCVSSLLCRSGKCCKDAMATCGASGDCCSGACGNGYCCKPANTFCDTVNPCCPGWSCQSSSCCRPAGGTCSLNGDCCSGVCVNGTCAAGLVTLHGTCDETNDCDNPLLCRSGKCCKDAMAACEASGDCCSGACANASCCKPANTFCDAINPCCPGAVCQNDVCCKPNGSSCQNNAHCCSGICVSGVCAANPVPLGGTCDSSSNCVSGLICRSMMCCKDTSITCSASSECCEDSVCLAGSCIDLVEAYLTECAVDSTTGLVLNQATCDAFSATISQQQAQAIVDALDVEEDTYPPDEESVDPYALSGSATKTVFAQRYNSRHQFSYKLKQELTWSWNGNQITSHNALITHSQSNGWKWKGLDETSYEVVLDDGTGRKYVEAYAQAHFQNCFFGANWTHICSDRYPWVFQRGRARCGYCSDRWTAADPSNITCSGIGFC